jgi:hypothetical protein
MATDINERHGPYLLDDSVMPTTGGNPGPENGACSARGHKPVTQNYLRASEELLRAHIQSQSQRECSVNASAEHSAERVRYYLSIAGQPNTVATDCHPIPGPRFPVPLPPGYLPGVV